jgi:hypothetical protein
VPNAGKDNKQKPPEDNENDEKKLKLAKAYQATLDNANNNSDMSE